MSICCINKEKFENDKKIKKLIKEELERVDEDLTSWMDEILRAGGEMANKVDLQTYKRLKDLRDRVRVVL